MIMSNLYLIALSAVGLVAGFYYLAARRRQKQVTELTTRLAEKEQQNQVLTTRINNQQERKRNESKAINANRSQLIDSLQQSGDLRDE
nr:MAG TPA: Protein of unknown function (DUF2681) [Caudoviricetes sp.]